MLYPLKLLCFFVSLSFFFKAEEKDKVSIHLLYRDGYTYSSLKLNKNGSYIQKESSCTYGFTSKGNWKRNKDTIMLQHKSYSKTFGGFQRYAERMQQLVFLTDSTANYHWYIDAEMPDYNRLRLQ